jgi:hypothetical protein
MGGLKTLALLFGYSAAQESNAERAVIRVLHHRTAAEVTTVSEIADWKFTPGRITEQLMSDYTERVAAQRQSRRGLAPRLDRVALTAARRGRAIGR